MSLENPYKKEQSSEQSQVASKPAAVTSIRSESKPVTDTTKNINVNKEKPASEVDSRLKKIDGYQNKVQNLNNAYEQLSKNGKLNEKDFSPSSEEQLKKILPGGSEVINKRIEDLKTIDTSKMSQEEQKKVSEGINNLEKMQELTGNLNNYFNEKDKKSQEQKEDIKNEEEKENENKNENGSENESKSQNENEKIQNLNKEDNKEKSENKLKDGNLNSNQNTKEEIDNNEISNEEKSEDKKEENKNYSQEKIINHNVNIPNIKHANEEEIKTNEIINQKKLEFEEIGDYESITGSGTDHQSTYREINKDINRLSENLNKPSENSENLDQITSDTIDKVESDFINGISFNDAQIDKLYNQQVAISDDLEKENQLLLDLEKNGGKDSEEYLKVKEKAYQLNQILLRKKIEYEQKMLQIQNEKSKAKEIINTLLSDKNQMEKISEQNKIRIEVLKDSLSKFGYQ